jgi:hypothetical protein
MTSCYVFKQPFGTWDFANPSSDSGICASFSVSLGSAR